jgi:hypothetical protein
MVILCAAWGKREIQRSPEQARQAEQGAAAARRALASAAIAHDEFAIYAEQRALEFYQIQVFQDPNPSHGVWVCGGRNFLSAGSKHKSTPKVAASPTLTAAADSIFAAFPRNRNRGTMVLPCLMGR